MNLYNFLDLPIMILIKNDLFYHDNCHGSKFTSEYFIYDYYPRIK
jgi:hypothetical protein